MSEPSIRNVAVVGLGIGIAHVRALRRLRDRFALVAVCDPDESRSAPVAERTHGFASIPSLPEAAEALSLVGDHLRRRLAPPSS